MNGRSTNGSRDDADVPQLQMWDDEGRNRPIGTIQEDGVEWELGVILEPVSSDLVRGRLSFRSGEERYVTAPVLVEESTAAVIRRAEELPGAMVRQLLASARG
ncbi:MAG: hypothetical protein ACE5HP_09905 [Gemmatimonadota bacterium]